MEEREDMPTREQYLRIISETAYYFKKRDQMIWRAKYELFAAGGGDNKIDIFSNSLELMGSLCGHKMAVYCLAATFPNS